MWTMGLSSNVPLNWTDGSNILAAKIIISQQVYYTHIIFPFVRHFGHSIENNYALI